MLDFGALVEEFGLFGAYRVMSQQAVSLNVYGGDQFIRGEWSPSDAERAELICAAV